MHSLMKSTLLSLCALAAAPLAANDGPGSGGGSFPRPNAFTLVFWDVAPSEAGLRKYAGLLADLEKSIGQDVALGRVAEFRKQTLVLEQKRVRPVPPKPLFTVCANYLSAQDAFRVLKGSGASSAGVRIVEGASCESAEIQELYRDQYQW